MRKVITYFYVEPQNVDKDHLKIMGDEAKHITLVLRKGKGEVIEVVNGEGIKYQARISETGKDQIIAVVLNKTRKENEPIVYLTLAQALIKGVRMDFLIEKVTEIGVSSFIPLITERSMIKLSKEGKGFNRLNRWKRIAISSMKQSLRSILPDIQKPVLFQDILTRAKDYDLALIACQSKKSKSIKEIFESSKIYKKVLIIVGPESGFSQEELEKAFIGGIIPITLGQRRLRSETAGFVFSSLVLHELEDLG